MSNFRSDRVSTEIKREINDILHNKIRDPRLEDVNITDVKVTGDLSQASIYYSLLSDLASDNEKAQKAFKKANGVIRSELAKRMSLYKVPELIFVKDESVEYGNKIDELLRNLNKN
ncbi:ribosome-binding factor A [Floricoccus penangensis]|uniref:Ribosome-binding factor A n=1 Tax=Floricoccus penangensis TaxID=1859475 RepID=A0A9Q5JFY6_9LACT|nr:30S ribosome-binding factor RbfA [Floricoccus penangensis]OFI46266.1 ribosome-binding factor A [Floricoccus penangensis]